MDIEILKDKISDIKTGVELQTPIFSFDISKIPQLVYDKLDSFTGDIYECADLIGLELFNVFSHNYAYTANIIVYLFYNK